MEWFAAGRRNGIAPGLFVIRLEGEFDLLECQRLKEAFAIPKTAALVVLDFKRATFIDSRVVEALTELHRTTESRGASLILVGVQPRVRRIFEICGLLRLFDIRDGINDVEAARTMEPARVRMLTLCSRRGPAGG